MSAERRKSPKVVVGIDSWRLSGVTSFAVNLVMGLRNSGFDTRLLCTNSPWAAPTRFMKPPAGFQYDSLPPVRVRGWRTRWKILTEYLQAHAPCIYVPNTDIGFASASPMLPDDIMSIGVLHADEPFHYEHAQRIGASWNAIVCVSNLIAERARIACPNLAPEKFVAISNSVPPASAAFPRRQESSRPIRLLYAGRVSQYQKRIFDLVSICGELGRSSIPYSLTIAGDGPDRIAFEEKAAAAGILPNLRLLGTVTPEGVMEEMKRHDCLLLTSEFEGMPMVMMEAMSAGCIPIVTRIESGVSDVISDGENGFLCPVGDHVAFARVVGQLARQPELRRAIGEAAWETLHSGPHSFGAFIDAWGKLISEVFDAANRAPFGRMKGPATPHAYMPITIKDRIVWSFRAIRSRVKTQLKQRRAV